MSVVILCVALALVVIYVIRARANNQAAAEHREAGNAFLEANRSREGVQTTPSGLQYQVLRAGIGSEHPTARSRVEVHYHGTLLGGTVFDSSVNRGAPLRFGLNQVIKGWTEGVQLMVVGEKTRFWIPSQLAYGNRPAGAIAPGSLLVFEVELLAIE